MPLTVLVVAGGGFQGESLVSTIRAIPDTRVIVADTIADNLGRYFADRYLVSPAAADLEQFAQFLEETIRREHVDLVLPCSNLVIKPLASLRNRIEAAGARLGSPGGRLVDVLLDKQLTYEALLDAGVPVQRPVPLSLHGELPLCGKPRNGWGGRDMLVVRTASELATLDIDSLARSHCWVPWVREFDEFSADFAIDFDGRVSPITLRRRVRTSGGFAVISESVCDASLEKAVQDTSQWLASQNGSGIFNVQVLRLPDGTLYVSDINPRHGTSSCHAHAEGNGLVAFLMGLPHRQPSRPVRTVRTLGQHSMPMPIDGRWDGVVFDLDDTLIDHKRWLMDKMAVAASALSWLVAPERLLRATYAIVEEGHHDRLIDMLASRLQLDHAHAELLAAYRAAMPNRATLFAEVPDVLSSLRAAGFRIALLTDNPPASQRAKLATIPEISSLFDTIVFSREHGGEKPDTNAFLVTSQRLGLAPESLLMVGDNVARDALGAVQAGFDSCLLVSRPGVRHHHNHELLQHYWPEVCQRSWTAPDLRVLATLGRVSSRP